MSSQRRIDSSRANGARSRGPKTPEGLARCQAAPITHGLTARQVVLPGESEEEFRALRDAYLVHFRPRSVREVDLVTLLAATRWRLGRLGSFETDVFNAAIARQEPGLREDLKIAAAFRSLCDESNAFANLDRYSARLNRIHQAALKALPARQEKNRKIKNRNRVPVPSLNAAAPLPSSESPEKPRSTTRSQFHK